MPKIQTRTTVIPVEFDDLTFEFHGDDESLKKIQLHFEALAKGEEAKPDGIDAQKVLLRDAYDMVLGVGAFEKIYAKTPSTAILLSYWYEMFDGISDELNKVRTSDKRAKYLNLADAKKR